MTPKLFIQTLVDAAIQSMRETGIPASFTLAEAALESGWGKSLLALEAKNLFGVKADKGWNGAVYLRNTREYLNNQWVMVPARWRKYATWLECMKDHALFLLTNQRYHHCFEQKTGIEFAKAVAEAGYATDPEYAAKIAKIILAYDLEQYDNLT
jgi:flagellum-specific peptidoglycan hydrolase FlgJ